MSSSYGIRLFDQLGSVRTRFSPLAFRRATFELLAFGRVKLASISRRARLASAYFGFIDSEELCSLRPTNKLGSL
eukprot:6193826-Pleurochrysis_carterae.AAC.2